MTGQRNAPSLVVRNDRSESQSLPRRRLKIRDIEGKRAVAGQKYDGTIRIRQPGCHCASQAPAHNTASPARQPISRVLLRAEQLVRPLADAPTVDQQNRILRQYFFDRANYVDCV